MAGVRYTASHPRGVFEGGWWAQELRRIERGISSVLGLLFPASATTSFTASAVAVVTTDGMDETHTFNADGTITSVYGAPVSQTVTTTFNADGTITEAVA